MRNQRVTSATLVANQLFTAEAAIDAAIQATAQLNALLPTARIDAGLSAMLGQGALEAANASLAQLIRARHEIVEAHAQLDEVKTQIGLREMAFGAGALKASAPEKLRVVARQAA